MFESLLGKLSYYDRHAQSYILNGIGKSIQHATPTDVQQLLSYACVCNDSDITIKLFSIFSASVILNTYHYETVGLCAAIYDKANNELNNGLSSKTKIILNLLTALVYVEDKNGIFSQQYKVTQYAQNMIRISGCLSTIAEFFNECVMNIDTWRILCLCLAECCRGSHKNKNYCSHLIPICVEKIKRGNSEVIFVLQSLLEEHPQNCERFLSCSGLHIFTKQILQRDHSSHLLATLIENVPHVVKTVRNSNIPQYLQQILDLHGTQSQIGQWCSICLFKLSKNIKREFKENYNNIMKNEKFNETNKHNQNIETKFNDTTSLYKNVLIEIMCSQTNDHADINKSLFNNIFGDMHQNSLQNASEVMSKKTKDSDPRKPQVYMDGEQFKMDINRIETDNNSKMFIKDFMQKTVLENNDAPETINENVEHNEFTLSFLDEIKKYFLKQNTLKKEKVKTVKLPSRSKGTVLEKKDVPETMNDNELSFSFVDEIIRKPSKKYLLEQNALNKENEHKKNQKVVKLPSSSKDCQTSFESSFILNTNIQEHKGGINDILIHREFDPLFTSTPKNYRMNHKATISPQCHRLKKKHIINRKHMCKNDIRKLKASRVKILENIKGKINKSQNNSLSSRVFTAINESCTTFVKTLKDIFLPTKSTTIHERDKTKELSKVSSAYSFINYMRMRDQFITNSNIDGINASNQKTKDSLFAKTRSINEECECETCNNTSILKSKLMNNGHLKLTVKKLKNGINRYGCNFKKIAEVYWPGDSYVNATVLYNLYRKLILK